MQQIVEFPPFRCHSTYVLHLTPLAIQYYLTNSVTALVLQTWLCHGFSLT